MDKKFYTVKELGDVLPIGTTSLYKLVHSKDFPSITINHKILIPVDKLEKWIEESSGATIVIK